MGFPCTGLNVGKLVGEPLVGAGLGFELIEGESELTEGQDVLVLVVGLVDGELDAAHAVLFARADGRGGAVVGENNGIGGHAGLDGPGEAQVIEFLGCGPACGKGVARFVRSFRRNEIVSGKDAVLEGLLHNKAAVGKALDVEVGRREELFELSEPGQFHDTQVFA